MIPFIVLGIMAGLLSGLFGIGGGLIIVPALVMFFGLSQKLAQGTSLAILLPPVGALAVYRYYKNGNVDFKIALFVALGLIVGGYFGSQFANQLSAPALKKAFGSFLIVVGVYYTFFKN